MQVVHLILREILYRKLNFALGLLSAVAAAGSLVAALTVLQAHDRRTEALVAARETETRERLGKLEEDYRRITVKMGFNLLILPKDQNLNDLYADDYASKYMPEEYAERLAKAHLATINHLMPSLQQKLKWPEQERTVILIGVRGEVLVRGAGQQPILEAVPPGELVAGFELHRSLKLSVGQKVKLLGREFTVAKLHPERGTKDDISLWINLGEAQELLDKKSLINALLALECHCAAQQLPAIRAEVGRILPDTQAIEFATQALARAEARNRAQAEAEQALEQEKQGRARLRHEREAFAAVLVPLVVVAAALWIGFLAFLNVRERRSEIGILCALGVRSAQILAIFLGKAVLLGLLGAALGYLAGALSGWRLQEAPPVLTLGEVFNTTLLLQVLVFAPAVTALASWLPAFWAAQQDPAEILREG
ncbi:MAG: FtsX-like permease family protein [Planctomycetota bacterium]